MGNIFHSDYIDFLAALNSHGVKYVLIGGYSVIYHGFPRTTGDLDVFVEVSEENFLRIEDSFKSFGMPMFDLTMESFLNDSSVDVYTFGRPPVAIEVIKRIDGIDFNQVWKNSSHVEFDSIPMKIIHLKDLVQNKKASARPKDLNDLENLEY